MTPLRSPIDASPRRENANDPPVELTRWEVDDLRDENKQLRTLVIELSRIILKNVVSTP